MTHIRLPVTVAPFDELPGGAWLQAHNPGLRRDFLSTDPPDRKITLPDGQSVPIYRLKQFLGVNFRLTFLARKPEGTAFTTATPTNLRGEAQGESVEIAGGKLAIDLPAYAPASYVLR